MLINPSNTEKHRLSAASPFASAARKLQKNTYPNGREDSETTQSNPSDQTEKQSAPIGQPAIPVTVFTGFLGAGKTTIILNIIKSLPKDYRVAWLKNEFGNIAVDSELAKSQGISMVKEMLNGCICHVLIGQLGTAIEELAAQNPNRIIIETSGSAAPAPIVWEVRKHPRLAVDGVINVIDAENFPGYKDKSYTAKLQAKYTDLILINKHESVTESDLDRVLDDVYEINPETPKVKTDRGTVDKDLVFGLDTKIFDTAASVEYEERNIDKKHQDEEVELMEIVTDTVIRQKSLIDFLDSIPKEDIYRVKGFVRTETDTVIVNWAFGRTDIRSYPAYAGDSKLILMGRELDEYPNKTAERLGIDRSCITLREHDHH